MQRMRRSIYSLIFFVFVELFLLTGIYGSLFAQSSFEGKKIVSVEFDGLVQSDELSVKSVINTKPRSLFSQKVLDDDIKSLYNLGLFNNITVEAVEKEEGVAITFIFEELPTIREIIVRGNRRASDRSIKDEIVLKKGSVYNESEALNDLQRIVDLYESKGYPDTSADFRIRKTREKDKKTGERIEGVDLIFSIDEGKKLVITSIEFSGVSVVKKERLINVMKTKERGYLLSRGFLKEVQFEIDKGEILRYYADRGYIDARIVKIDKDIQQNEKKKRKEMILTIYIEEGEQYTFDGVTITGNKIFTDSELYELITLEKDTVFNKTEWESNVQAIRDLLAENGYIYYGMDIDETKDSENLLISYSIHITENNKAHVEHIFITGNEKTKDFVIERELQIHEGEIFNVSKIRYSQEKLYNLQYFAGVNIDVKPGTELGLVDLIFDVEEQRTGMFSFGLSYSTAGYGLSFFEEVSARNFLGRGLRLYEKVDVGFRRQSVTLGFDEPWLFHTPTSAGFTLSWSRTEYGSASGDLVYTYNDGQKTSTDKEVPDGVEFTENPDGTIIYDYSDAESMEYVQNKFGIQLRLGRRFARYYGIEGELGFSVFKNYSDSDDVPFDTSLREQYEDDWPWYWKNSLSLLGYRDTRDSRIFATRGNYVGQTVTFFGGPLGGYSDFIHLNTELNVNAKTFWRFVLSSRLSFGFILPFFGADLTVDDIDYLRIDGMNEGRGWQHPSQWGVISSERGRSELHFSLEHRLPIEPRLLWALTFFDVSGIYDEPKDFSIDPRELYYSVGLGMSFVIPAFPIRIYLARRFKYDETRDKLELANSQTFFRNWDFVFAVAGFF